MNMMFHYGLFLIGLELISLYAHAQTPPGNYEKLIKDIFVGYDKRVKPFANENQLVNISETLLGAILIEVEEDIQMASYVVTRKQMWIDPRFHWDPSKYNGTESVLVPARDVWKSDIFNFNCKEFENLLSKAKDWAKIEYNGQVSLIVPQYVETTCKIFVHRFPFDTQFCALSFSSNMMDNTMFTFIPIPVPYQTKTFMGNSAWSVDNVTIIHRLESDDGVWGEKGYVYSYVFQIKRCSTYYITVIVIPTFLITVVSIVGIFAPGTEHEPGDVANLGLGTLLALMVLLGIISDKLPKSQEMPLLGLYILIILIVFVLCILLEMASLYQFQKMTHSGERPPEWLYKVTLLRMFPAKKQDKDFMRLNRSSSDSTLKNHNREPSISSNGSDIKLNLENGFGPNAIDQNGVESPNKVGKKNLIKKVFSKTEKDFNQWKHVIGEFKNKVDERQAAIKAEWDVIETRLDFIWIVVFETFNVLNLLSLVYFADLPTPDSKAWLS